MVVAQHASPVALDLVTGFLGSGKTTLINAVLQDRAFAGTMVIVNEFGEVGLDHLLISSAEDQVVLLDSGCLCCAVSGSLRDTLIDLFSRRGSGSVAFDRIIVETSGLANPAPLVASLLGDSALTPRCTLSQVLTLVDAVHGPDTLARYQEAQRQVAFADRLLITKTDVATAVQVDELLRTLASLNPNAPIERWRQGDAAAAHFTATTADGAFVQTRPRTVPAPAWPRGPVRPQYADEIASLHGEAFGQIVTHVLRVPRSVDWAEYAAWTDDVRRRFGKRLLRCKGLLAIEGDDRRWVIQGVQDYFAKPVPLVAGDTTADPAGYLVCIGEALDRTELDKTLTLLGVDLPTERNPLR